MVGLGRAAVWTNSGSSARAQQPRPRGRWPEGTVCRGCAPGRRQSRPGWRARRAQPAGMRRGCAAALGDEPVADTHSVPPAPCACAASGVTAPLFARRRRAARRKRRHLDSARRPPRRRATRLAAALPLHAAATHADHAQRAPVAGRYGDYRGVAPPIRPMDAARGDAGGRAYAAGAGRRRCGRCLCARGARRAGSGPASAPRAAPEFRDSFLHRNPVHRDLLQPRRAIWRWPKVPHPMGTVPWPSPPVWPCCAAWPPHSAWRRR